MIRLHLLGSVELTNGDGAQAHSVLAQPKRVALLAYLAIARPRGFHRRDKLLALFWPDSDTDHARNALRQSLHFLRRALGPDLLTSRGDGEVGLDRDHIWADVVEFETSLEASGERALELYRGELMDGLFLSGAPAFERWLDQERTRLRNTAWEVACREAAELERRGDLRGALTLTRRARSLRPFHEETLRESVRRLHASGDYAGALAEYETFARVLSQELDTAPEADTVALVEGLARPPTETDPATEPSPPATAGADPGRSGVRWRWLGAAAVAALAVVGLVDRSRRDASPSLAADVAVMIPEYLGSDPDGPFLARGLQDEIIRNLNGESWIRAPSMLSVSRFAAQAVPSPRSVGSSACRTSSSRPWTGSAPT